MKPIAYTYYLYHKPTGQKYYGVRYSKKCHPSDLWITYFSSSQTVSDLIKEYGIDSFKFEVRKTFDSVDKARKWEQRVLWRLKVVRKRDWINKSYGTGWTDHVTVGMLGKKHSEETKAKMKISQTGENNGFYGKTHSKITKEKISKAHKGVSRPWTLDRIVSDETRRKISKSNEGKIMSDSAKKKISDTLMCHSVSNETKQKQSDIRKKNKWWTNGVVSTQAELSPGENWKRGRGSFNRSWYTNGISSVCVIESEVPNGYFKGRTISNETRNKISVTLKNKNKIKDFV